MLKTWRYLIKLLCFIFCVVLFRVFYFLNVFCLMILILLGGILAQVLHELPVVVSLLHPLCISLFYSHCLFYLLFFFNLSSLFLVTSKLCDCALCQFPVIFFKPFLSNLFFSFFSFGHLLLLFFIFFHPYSRTLGHSCTFFKVIHFYQA